MLGQIRSVTVCVPDLNAAEELYSALLDYRVTERGTVSDELAAHWGAPRMAGAGYLLMNPATADDYCFRFVERPAQEGFNPLTSFGWLAAEIMVQDVDALGERLADTGFRIIGEPADLSFTSDIRAMQIQGPGEEILYLTQFKNKVPGIDSPEARCSVDRTFIMILGGPEMSTIQDFYAREFGVARSEPMQSRVKITSMAFGLDLETLHPIALLTLNEQSFIEADELPEGAAPRANEEGMLPPGIAMVSFNADDLPADAPVLAGALYGNKPAVCVRGGAGEIVELLGR